MPHIKGLALSRRPGESIRIGNDIFIVIDRIEPGERVKVCVDAPRHMSITRIDRSGHTESDPLPPEVRKV